MATVTFGDQSNLRPYGVLTITEKSQNTANNTTTLTYTLVLKRPSSVYANYPNHTWSVVIDGITVANGAAMIGGSGDLLLASGTHTITHNIDGTKTINIGASIYLEVQWGASGQWIGWISGNSLMELTKINK